MDLSARPRLGKPWLLAITVGILAFANGFAPGARAQDTTETGLSAPVTVDIVALLRPPVLESKQRRIPIRKVSPRDPSKPADAVIEHEQVFTAEPGFSLAGSSLEVRQIQGMSRFSSKLSDDRKAVVLQYSLRNGAPGQAGPSVFDVTLRITEERRGRGKKVTLVSGITLERFGNYPLWDGRDAGDMTGAQIVLLDPDSLEILAQERVENPFSVPGGGGLIRIDASGATPILSLEPTKP